MTAWLVSFHPSAVIQDRTRNLRPWLSDVWKLSRMLREVPPQPEPETIVVESKEAFEHAVEGWSHFAFDIETDKDNNDFVHCLGVSNGEKSVIIDSIVGGQLIWAFDLFQREGLKIVQNGMFDMPIIARHGLTYDWTQTFDTLLAEAILSPDEPNSLAYIASVRMDMMAWKYKSGENLALYNGQDAARTYKAAKHQLAELKEKHQWEFFKNHVMPILWETIIPLHEGGAFVDEDQRRSMSSTLVTQIASWRADLEKHFSTLSSQTGLSLSPPLGEEGGFSFPKMAQLLYGALSLPKQYDPETGRLTISKEALQRIQPKDDTGTIELLLKRSVLGEIEDHVQSTQPGPDGRIHPRFVMGGDEKHEDLQGQKGNKNAPRTGRLSSREPNLQNVRWRARYLIRATPGLTLVERDYSQIELRLNAFFTHDPGLEAALRAGDAHLYIAWLVDHHHGKYNLANRTFEEVYAAFKTKDPGVKAARQEQKTPTYGWFYRMGAQKMYLAYGVPTDKARLALKGLNAAFPAVTEWWKTIVKEASAQRFIQNLFGRRRYFLNVKEEVPAICNFPAQSTAADVLYRAMTTLQRVLRCCAAPGPEALEVYRRLRCHVCSRPTPGRLILTVHDQILAEGPDPKWLNEVMKEAMDQAFPELGGMVIPSDAKIGTRWGPRFAPENVPDLDIFAGQELDPLGMEEVK